MNAVAMFLQQMQLPVKQGEPVKSLEDGEKEALFHALLANYKTVNMAENELLQEGEANKEGAMPLLFPVKTLEKHITTGEEMIQLSDFELTDDALNAMGLPEDAVQLDLLAGYQSFVNILERAEIILAQVTAGQVNPAKAAPKILDLLQEWVKLDNQFADRKAMEKAFVFHKKEGSAELGMWRDLMQSFEKRHQMTSKQQYSTNALVTTEDIVKWLGKTVEQALTAERRPSVQNSNLYTSATLPMARMEQYVVYVNQGQTTHNQGQQLIDQFENIIKSSNFMTLPNKGNQLTLSLRPENLGEMMVRFTQINGEMTVKILVTTQAAKEMLETNMHQLRNMFSPQQVVVEKQDALNQQGQETEKNLKDDQWDEQREQQSNDSSKEEKQQSDNDFAAQFEALVMNEEV